jgi:hypothetical protein
MNEPVLGDLNQYTPIHHISNEEKTLPAKRDDSFIFKA